LVAGKSVMFRDFALVATGSGFCRECRCNWAIPWTGGLQAAARRLGRAPDASPFALASAPRAGSPPRICSRIISSGRAVVRVLAMNADQAPVSTDKNATGTTFLGQDTAFYVGPRADRGAPPRLAPVMYVVMRRSRRGLLRGRTCIRLWDWPREARAERRSPSASARALRNRRAQESGRLVMVLSHAGACKKPLYGAD